MPQYRWKKMIGPRDRRPPYQGTWYPYSSNGWGIFDFLNFCEAAGFLGIPAVNMDEAPQDMADFMEYVNGPRSSEWGRRRAADGHPAPYRLRYLELGNEEAVDEAYWLKFKALAEAIWAKDPDVILVVGDFAYDKAIKDPYNFSGAPRIKTLGGAQEDPGFRAGAWPGGLVRCAYRHRAARRSRDGVPGVRSFIEQLGKLSPGARLQGGGVRIQRGQSCLETGAGQRPGHQPARTGRGPHRRRLLRQLPPALQAERQWLEPGPALSLTLAGLGPAAVLRDPDGLAQLPALVCEDGRASTPAAPST